MPAPDRASESPKITKACPECGGMLVERINKRNGSKFLGYDNWPVRRDESGDLIGCDHTEPVPAYWELIRQGAATLPGFGETS
jgi:ssDNA-binding Zn-finger/Zn-ribbon topoisomerase 1